jgi:hypothetical protein
MLMQMQQQTQRPMLLQELALPMVHWLGAAVAQEAIAT